MIAAGYAELQRILAGAQGLTDAAEAHGTLAGALCAAPAYRLDDWLGEILPDTRTDPMTREGCRAFFESTARALHDADMGFEVLLPDDGQQLDARAAALGQWCQGFLYGLGTSAIDDVTRLPGDVGDIVRDFTEITRIGVDSRESLESNENAYAELVEFVRVGVQLLFEELAPYRVTAPPATESLH
ncbi:MAG: hypothetical protein AMXMBFR37_27670 [Steroidobacteraceae bacterium]|nr:UPF0149 family protein [Steroidobacteraceae bacterium]